MKEHKSNWIQTAVKHPGALTRKAKAHHESVSEFIAHPPKNASPQTKRQINFAKAMKGLR